LAQSAVQLLIIGREQGTFAVICLLVGKSVSTYALNPSYTHEVMKDVNGTMTASAEMYTEMEIGTAVTFYCAIWQVNTKCDPFKLILGILNYFELGKQRRAIEGYKE
jgi:hypothetical protein